MLLSDSMCFEMPKEIKTGSSCASSLKALYNLNQAAKLYNDVVNEALHRVSLARYFILLKRSNITNPKTEYYLHYRGSVYCTEQEFGTFYMRSS